MNTAQIRCFLAVADTLNFARAAEQLHLTQPAVTHQIQTLEQELGVKLFARTTRTVRLTEEGGLFLADARGLDALAARAQVSAADLAAEPLALLAPYAAPPAVQRVQETLLGEHDPDTLHVCDSTEALTTLVAAGYGAAVLPLPQGPAQPPLARVPFAGAAPVSFGAYYKTTRDRPQLKAFLAAARDVFAPGGTPPAAKGV